MNLSVWEYLRRRTAEAVLAGFFDAFEYVERQDQSQAIHAAAKGLRRRLHDQPDASGANQNSANSAPQPAAANTQAPAVSPSNLAPPPVNGKPTAGSLLPNQAAQRRRPGRPRKEVHG